MIPLIKSRKYHLTVGSTEYDFIVLDTYTKDHANIVHLEFTVSSSETITVGSIITEHYNLKSIEDFLSTDYGYYKWTIRPLIFLPEELFEL